jgi:hypothetical protein
MGYRQPHPALKGRQRGIFHADLVGVIPGYPRDQEAYDKRRQTLLENSARARSAGKLSRKGVPNGWAGRRAELAAENRKADAEGTQIADAMVRAGLLHNGTEDDALANEAMAYVLSVIRNKSVCETLRQSAARQLLTFTMANPRSASKDPRAYAETLMDAVLARYGAPAGGAEADLSARH